MSPITTLLTAVRVGLVIVGGGIAALTVFSLASMPPPPPESDGFAHGIAALFGGGILLLSLGLATLGIIAPAVLGREDPLGFDRRQRLVLKGVGVMIGLGVVIALLTGLRGLVVLFALLVVAFGIVCAILVWRFAEVIHGRRATA